MAASSQTSATESWPPQPTVWVDNIMACINQLSEGPPKVSAKRVERNQGVQFELQVEWWDKLMKEPLVETFTYECDNANSLTQTTDTQK